MNYASKTFFLQKNANKFGYVKNLLYLCPRIMVKTANYVKQHKYQPIYLIKI